jgi:hypothetical protein
VHKGRNIIERLDPSLHAGVKKVLRQAWDSSTAEQAERVLKNLARRLDHDAPGVSASIHEGLDEMLTVIRLGLPDQLRRSLGCTNAIESLMAVLRQVCRNVKRWRDARMALRWTGTAMLEAEKSFRRLKAHKQLPVLSLVAATSASVARRPTHCQQKSGRIATDGACCTNFNKHRDYSCAGILAIIALVAIQQGWVKHRPIEAAPNCEGGPRNRGRIQPMCGTRSWAFASATVTG